jgi:hypothetical protein
MVLRSPDAASRPSHSTPGDSQPEMGCKMVATVLAKILCLYVLKASHEQLHCTTTAYSKWVRLDWELPYLTS